MAEFTINAQQYRSARIPAFTQFHIARRLAPILTSLTKAYKESNDTKNTDIIFEPVAEALSTMKDADVDYVLNACLAVVSRLQNGAAYSAIKVGNNMMFEDIGLAEIMQITVRVLQDNLGNFLSGPSLASASAK